MCKERMITLRFAVGRNFTVEYLLVDAFAASLGAAPEAVPLHSAGAFASGGRDGLCAGGQPRSVSFLKFVPQ